jgi:hypothetical protein
MMLLKQLAQQPAMLAQAQHQHHPAVVVRAPNLVQLVSASHVGNLRSVGQACSVAQG